VPETVQINQAENIAKGRWLLGVAYPPLGLVALLVAGLVCLTIPYAAPVSFVRAAVESPIVTGYAALSAGGGASGVISALAADGQRKLFALFLSSIALLPLIAITTWASLARPVAYVGLAATSDGSSSPVRYVLTGGIVCFYLFYFVLANGPLQELVTQAPSRKLLPVPLGWFALLTTTAILRIILAATGRLRRPSP
jgi:hypothetical protein